MNKFETRKNTHSIHSVIIKVCHELNVVKMMLRENTD